MNVNTEVEKSCVNCLHCKVKFGEVRCAKGRWITTRNNIEFTKKEIDQNGHFVNRAEKWSRKKAEGCLRYE